MTSATVVDDATTAKLTLVHGCSTVSPTNGRCSRSTRCGTVARCALASCDSEWVAASARMLTKTLRVLERDGLVTRRVHPVVPPRVDYKLTKRGELLSKATCGIREWVDEHLKDVERSRRLYDRRLG